MRAGVRHVGPLFPEQRRCLGSFSLVLGMSEVAAPGSREEREQRAEETGREQDLCAHEHA